MREEENRPIQEELPSAGFEQEPKKRASIYQLWVGSGIGTILLAVLIWLYFPVLNQWISGLQPSTPTPAIPTTTPTRTLRPSLTPTITLTPSPTPLPPSAYQLHNPESLRPPLAMPAQRIIVLNDDTSLTVEPDFNNPQWTSSAQIGSQFGVEISESFYATFAPGSATWQMDVPLEPGLYELFVMDTLYGSGGYLDFQVRLGERELTPLLGQQRVNYQSSHSVPPQTNDRWRSIGVYALDQNGLLSVSTQWGARDFYTITAIDRVLIVHLPESSQTLVDRLPVKGDGGVVDNLAARIETSEFLLDYSEALAWGGQYQVIPNPSSDARVIWELPEFMPIGRYQVLVWIPPVVGKAEASYHFIVKMSDGSDLISGELAEPIQLTQSDYAIGQWLPLGIWEIPAVYGDLVRFKLALQMDVKGGTLGEIAIDAAAFIKQP